MPVPKGTLDKGLTVVPISTPRYMLASMLAQHCKFPLRSPCWYPGSSPSSFPHVPYPKLLQFLGFPSPKFSILHISAISGSLSLGPFSCLSLFFPSLALPHHYGWVQSLFPLPALDSSRLLWLCSPSCLQ